MGHIDEEDAVEFLIRQHGREAPAYAGQLAEAMRESGDHDAAAAWLKIQKAAQARLDADDEGDAATAL